MQSARIVHSGVVTYNCPTSQPCLIAETEHNFVMNWTGLAAIASELADQDETGSADYAFIRGLLTVQSGPALDVGCGTGRLLLRLLRESFDVDGIDTSADMLARCTAKAKQLRLNPQIYQQAMQQLDLPRRYTTIFITDGLFSSVISLNEAWETLVRINAHLVDGGLLVFNLLWPFSEGKPLSAKPLGAWGEWGEIGQQEHPDGSIIAQQLMRLKIDRVEQLLFAKRRYQQIHNGAVVAEEIFDAHERWYYKHEMLLMLEKTGFHTVQVKGDWTHADFNDSHSNLIFLARK